MKLDYETFTVIPKQIFSKAEYKLEILDIVVDTDMVKKDPNRIPLIIGKLAMCWSTNPDLRLTQLLWHLAKRSPMTFFYVEDDVIEKQLDKFIEKGHLEE